MIEVEIERIAVDRWNDFRPMSEAADMCRERQRLMRCGIINRPGAKVIRRKDKPLIQRIPQRDSKGAADKFYKVDASLPVHSDNVTVVVLPTRICSVGFVVCRDKSIDEQGDTVIVVRIRPAAPTSRPDAARAHVNR